MAGAPPLRIFLLAPPGAGKSTQAGRLAAHLDLAHLSSGDLLRAEIRAGSPLGIEAEAYLREGTLAPDELVMRVVDGALRRAGSRYVLDGFPRDAVQARMLRQAGHPEPDVVVVLAAPEETLIRRISGRRQCPRGHTHHVAVAPASTPGRCDTCGGRLARRIDDRPEAVRTRLAVYRDRTFPLIEHYRGRSHLVEVDADASVDEVTTRLLRAVRDTVSA